MSDLFVDQDKVVTFTYSIVDEAGDLLEESELPVSYVHGGKHDLFDKVVEELDGCILNDTVEVSLAPEEGFGARDPSLTYIDDLENVPQEYRHVGAEVEMMNDRGESRPFTVTHIADGKLTLDGNHPMAGKVITFRIKVTGIREATTEELADGVAATPPPVLH